MKIKDFLLFLPILLVTNSFASEVSDSDIGIYVTPHDNSVPVYYRLSKTDGKFILENTANKPMYCSSDCEFKESTETDIQKYFPEGFLNNFVVACIQNPIMAFCRYSPKDAQDQKNYALFALYSQRPAFTPISRIPPEEAANKSFKHIISPLAKSKR